MKTAPDLKLECNHSHGGSNWKTVLTCSEFYLKGKYNICLGDNVCIPPFDNNANIRVAIAPVHKAQLMFALHKNTKI